MSDFDFVDRHSLPTPQKPIADLSYRGYDGTLKTRAARWWIVALEQIRIHIRKPGFWTLAVLASLSYAPIIVMVYTGATAFIANSGPNGYTIAFFQALQRQQFLVMLVGLVVGSGCIATDNRANALLVYLSKPITKTDYVFGKWFGVFTMMYGVVLVPAIITYSYCAISLTGQGFASSDPQLPGRIFVGTLIGPIVQASLLIGFSAWAKSARAAGAAYFGFYTVTGIIASIIGSLVFKSHSPDARQIQALSVQGGINGLIQCIYHVSTPVRRMSRETGEMVQFSISPPPTTAVLAICVALTALGILAARSKVRAVEVVRG